MPSASAILMTVNQMIDQAFGELDRNRVNFKLLRFVLLIFAAQLNLVERKVAVNMRLREGTGQKVGVRQIKLKVRKKKSLGTKSSNLSKKSSNAARPDTSKQLKKKASTASSKTKTLPKISTLTYTMETSSLPAFATVSEKKERTNVEKYHKLLEKIEEKREKVLRIIDKKSKTEIDGSITPVSPLEPLEPEEYEYERLLIVEAFPDVKLDRNTSETEEVLSLVTLDQYNDLVKIVGELNERFADGNYGSLEFPENAELMKKLRQGASLTDAMGALQISARLEAVEKTMKNLITMITDFGHIAPKDASKVQVSEKTSKHKPTEASTLSLKAPTQSEVLSDYVTKSMMNQFVTHGELEEAVKRTRDEIQNYLKNMYAHPNSIWEKVNQQTREMELALKGKTTAVWNQKFAELEKKITSYSQHVNEIDSTLSSQMSNFQEQLTQMHFDVEAGLDNLAENLTSKAVDQTIMMDLMHRVGFVAKHIERANAAQKEFSDIQHAFAEDLEVKVKKEIEVLRDVKTDREELIDALRDVVGLKQLNGLVQVDFFLAVKGDLEQRISDAYKRFDSMEKIWQQKYIDEVFTEICEKADQIFVDSLADDIHKHLNKFKKKLQTIEGILGEPLAAAVTRKVYRDTICISCSTPAHVIPPPPPEEALPRLPPIRPPAIRPQAIGEEAPKPSEDDIRSLCYPGRRIKHPLDKRAELCTRYCGGPAKGRLKKKPSTGINVVPINKKGTSVTIGTDGKAYKTEMQPCLPCNAKEQDLRAELFEPLEGSEAEIFQEMSHHSAIPTAADSAAQNCGCEIKDCSCGVPSSELISHHSAIPTTADSAAQNCGCEMKDCLCGEQSSELLSKTLVPIVTPSIDCAEKTESTTKIIPHSGSMKHTDTIAK